MGRRKRGWNAASGLALADLQRLIESKQGELTARRNALAAEIEEIDATLASAGANGAMPVRRRGPGRPPKVAGKRGPGRPPRAKRGPGRPPKANAKRGRPPKKAGSPKAKRAGRPTKPSGQSHLHDRIRAAMTGATEPMKAADIARKVVAAGYKSASKVFHLIVGQRLAEMKDVEKPERGLYVLR